MASLKAERAEVDWLTAISWEAAQIVIEKRHTKNGLKVAKWYCVVQSKNGHNFSWDLLLWVVRVRYKVGATQEHAAKAAEPFCLYTSHFAAALQPLNTSELAVLGGSARSHSCQFVNFVLYSVNVPFFPSVNRHLFCDKLLLVPPLRLSPTSLSFLLCREMK